MKKFLRTLFSAALVVIAMTAILSSLGSALLPVYAQEDTPTAQPQRRTTITVNYTGFEWWLSRWTNNRIACRVVVDHEGRPTNSEIGQECSDTVYQQWLETTTCAAVGQGKSAVTCSGFYLQLAWTGPLQKKVVVDLPTPSVWITVDGCTLTPPNNRCKTLPNLILTGEEPLPNEVIIRLQGTINGRPFSCPGNQCAIPLQPTGIQGITIEFWADSSFGDSSKHYTAQVRAMPWGDFMAPEGNPTDQKSYYVDVISSQFREGNLTSCTDVWKTFPDIGGPPPWLTTPKEATALDSSQGYYYLAGMLIQNGAVDASSCPGGGLDVPGLANSCGVDAAGSTLRAWQNQFNTEILDVSHQTGIPAQLVKNIFSRESQFWPGLYKNYQEAGLGQMTEDGAETLLLYNPEFFKQFCPLVLDRSICGQRTYGGMTDPEVADVYAPYLPILRGALVSKVNSTCENCPMGIDLTQAKFSIRVFAESMVANCQQVGQMIFNTTEKMPGEVSTFTDLWKYTLVNYNAGPGCLGDAIEKAWLENEKLTWPLVSAQLLPACQTAIQYVEDITRYPAAAPTPTPRILVGAHGQARPPVLPATGQPFSPPAATPQPSPTGPTSTPRPTGTPAPGTTPTEEIYPYPVDETIIPYP